MTNQTVNSHWLLCTKCRSPLPPRTLQEADHAQCPSCWTELEAHVFPALFRHIAPGETAESVMVEGESGCFYHPSKKAVVPCESCGRFLCALCDVQFNGRHLCAPCIESGRKKGRHHQFENQRTRYDLMAMALTGLPIIACLWPLLIITAPAGIFVACRFWNAPGSLVTGGMKWRHVAAILLGVVGLVLWCLLAYSVIRSGVRR
jgi:uncharacterized paraquat-inducible protein A